MQFTLNGQQVEVDDGGATLLDLLRERLGVTSAKDGCSPQGQCGCCTVLVDGAPRVACVTPARRVAGRSVTTLEGLDADRREAWAGALVATGGSQCGFCTPGILLRLAVVGDPGTIPEDKADTALLAHLCRCTGWQTIVEAASGGVRERKPF
ncbi:MAG TPA: 2Fe-2S iron-sulfur cluster-binding protein, partial [Acidimicrobiales bacterium]|nr:2Fe-2S iron-sulfur cluster-binding protein [Acidimicrobiales bacterium]